MEKFGSGIWDKHPGSATPVEGKLWPRVAAEAVLVSVLGWGWL